MQIFLNKEPLEIPSGTSLHDLVIAQGISVSHVAIAVNMQVIRRDLWQEIVLSHGDKVVVIGISKGG